MVQLVSFGKEQCEDAGGKLPAAGEAFTSSGMST